MSWQAQAWVWTLEDISPLTKLVALAYANYAGSNGERIWAGVERIAVETGAAEKSVRRARDDLIERGYMIAIRAPAGRGRPGIYAMPIDMERVARHHNKGGQSEKGGQGEAERWSEPCEKVVIDVAKGGHSDLQTLDEPKSEPKHKPKTLTLTSERSKTSLLDFVKFWELYPRKVGKLAARKAYIRAVRQSPAAAIIDGVTAYSFPADPQFIPHASTWLNEGRWMDELPAPPIPASRGLFLDDPPDFDSSDAFGANAWGHSLTDTENHHKDGVPVLALRGYPIIEFAREVCEAAGWDQDTRCDLEPIAQAIRAGYDPDMMVEVVKTVRRPDRPTLRYYEAIWRDRHAKRSVS